MDACQRLVRHLNRIGQDRWRAEATGAGAPCRIRAPGPPARELDVRLVEGLEEIAFWRSLARDAEVVWTGTAAALANQVRQAIVRHVEEMPEAVERGATALLVLAGAAPSLTAATVADAFRRRHGSWAAGLGFHGVWLMGSGEDGVYALDGPDEPPAGAP